MKFVTFQHNGHQHAGVVQNDNVISLKSAGLPDVLSVLQGGPEALKRVEALLAKPPADAVLPLSAVKLNAPIPKPTKIICVGLNYRDHAIESKMEIPKVPTIFIKLASALIGPNAAIELPSISSQPDTPRNGPGTSRTS